MATQVGTLTINMQAGTAQFQTAMSQVQKSLRKTATEGVFTGKTLSDVFEKIGQKIGQLVSQMVAIGKATIDSYDAMGNLAQRTGTTTEQLSKLVYAGKFANVSMDQLGQSMTYLAEQMALAQSGNKQAQQSFKDIGLAFQENGKIRDTGAVYVDLGKKISQYADNANKTLAIQRLLGKSGTEQIALLNNVGDSWDKLSGAAEKAGQVVSDEMTKKASDFNNAMAEMRMRVGAAAAELGIQLLPIIEELASMFTTLIVNVADALTAMWNFASNSPIMGFFADLADVAGKAFDLMTADWVAALDLMGNAWDKFKALPGIEKLFTGDLGNEISDLIAQRETATSKAVVAAVPKPTLKIADRTKQAKKKIPKDVFAERMLQLTQEIQGQNALNSVIGQGEEAERAMAASIKATDIIREVNNQLIGKSKKLNEEQETALRGAVQTASVRTAQGAFAKSLDEQADSAELAAKQAQNLTEAMLQNADAVQKAQIANDELGLTYKHEAPLTEEEVRNLDRITAARRKVNEETNRQAEIDRLTQIAQENNSLRLQTQSVNELTDAMYRGHDARVQAEKDAATRELRAQQALTTDRDQYNLLERQIKQTEDAVVARKKAQLIQDTGELLSPAQSSEIRRQAIKDENKVLDELLAKMGMVRTEENDLAISAKNYQRVVKQRQDEIANLLTSGKAIDGVRAFFDEMELEARTASQTMYDLMSTAFTGIVDNLTNLMTGMKTDFGSILKQMGQMLLKSALMQSFADLGKFLSGKSGGAGWLASAFGMAGKLFGGGLQSGGMVSPDRAYVVGEQGPEILTGTSGYIHSNTASRQMLAGSQSNVINYSIDARGTDPVLTEQRVRLAIVSSHNSAVITSNQVGQERKMRMPRNYRG